MPTGSVHMAFTIVAELWLLQQEKTVLSIPDRSFIGSLPVWHHIRRGHHHETRMVAELDAGASVVAVPTVLLVKTTYSPAWQVNTNIFTCNKVPPAQHWQAASGRLPDPDTSLLSGNSCIFCKQCNTHISAVYTSIRSALQRKSTRSNDTRGGQR